MSTVVVEKAKDWRRGAVVAAGVAAVAGAVYYYYWGRSSRGRKRDHSAVRKIMATRPSQSEQRFDIVGLYVYPVKSMKGVALETSGFDHLGLKNDRRFCVINAATGNLDPARQPADGVGTAGARRPEGNAAVSVRGARGPKPRRPFERGHDGRAGPDGDHLEGSDTVC